MPIAKRNLVDQPVPMQRCPKPGCGWTSPYNPATMGKHLQRVHKEAGKSLNAQKRRDMLKAQTLASLGNKKMSVSTEMDMLMAVCFSQVRGFLDFYSKANKISMSRLTRGIAEALLGSVSPPR